MVEYFQEGFWVGVMFFDLGGDGDWVRIGGWCVFEVGLGFLIFQILGIGSWILVMVIGIEG